jgi:response regulator RpfG family c-di-GMP phosphodiesterase
MSPNNLPDTLPTIQKLIQRTQVAERSQQKEIRISLQEARDLTTELALMTSKLGQTISEIHQMLAVIKESTTQIDVKFDGGQF